MKDALRGLGRHPSLARRRKHTRSLGSRSRQQKKRNTEYKLPTTTNSPPKNQALTDAEAEVVALRGAAEAALAPSLGPVETEEGAAACGEHLALINVKLRLRVRVVVLAHRG